jgi:H+/Cl- antiporter ClcA
VKTEGSTKSFVLGNNFVSLFCVSIYPFYLQINRLKELFWQLFRWLFIALIVGFLAGTASAGFLASLDWVTNFRESNHWIIGLLPLGGLFVGFIYHQYGRAVESGNNLILDEIHAEVENPGKTIPLRMAPLVLFGTIATHFFGGSAGREGTAIQMGASLADQLNRPLRINHTDRKILLMSGMSAGFASVFGTPLAGAIFGLEILSIGRIKYEAIFPCFIAAFVANQVTLEWGIHHTAYFISFAPALTAVGLFSAIAAGICFGTVGMLFSRANHKVSDLFKKYIHYPPFRPLVGGAIVAALVFSLGTTKYIGLGIPTIVNSFQFQLPPWDFAAKFIFTVITLGAGFKGGEVTPLFFIGAALGNALGYILPLPFPLLAGMGFVAVFAGAANTPISSTIMAIEIFSGKSGAFTAIACVVSYLFSGHSGIYHSQRDGHQKHSQ